MSTRITVRQAAEILGTTQDFVRYHMRIGDLPIGSVMKSKGRNKSYMIYLDKVNKFIGKEEAS